MKFHYFSRCSDVCATKLGQRQISTHLVLLILERDFKGLGCTDHGLHRSEDVLVDQFGETLLIFICVA